MPQLSLFLYQLNHFTTSQILPSACVLPLGIGAKSTCAFNSHAIPALTRLGDVASHAPQSLPPASGKRGRGEQGFNLPVLTPHHRLRPCELPRVYPCSTLYSYARFSACAILSLGDSRTCGLPPATLLFSRNAGFMKRSESFDNTAILCSNFLMTSRRACNRRLLICSIPSRNSLILSPMPTFA